MIVKHVKNKQTRKAIDHKMRIGIVNDSQILTATLKNFIVDLGYEALSEIPSKTDYSAHYINNIDVLIIPQCVEKSFLHKMIKNNPEIMVVFIKNNGASMSANEALENRVYAFLSKPIHFDELEVVLARLEQYYRNNCRLQL